MKRKLLAMLLCVTLVFALFGTLAVAAEENVAQPTPSGHVCDCGTEDGSHAETCPCYVAPAPAEPAPSGPVCICGTEDGSHAETCPCYVAPTPAAPAPEEKPAHIETCDEDCTAAECGCICHVVDKLLATQNLDEFYALIMTLTQEQLDAMAQEQLTQVVAHMEAMEPQPAPAIVLEQSEPPVESEVYTPAKDFTNVAPLVDSVSGK